MASGSLGASNIKIGSLYCRTVRDGGMHHPCCARTCKTKKKWNRGHLMIISRTEKTWSLCCSSFSESHEHSHKSKSLNILRADTLNLSQVESLITRICETSSVEEFEMKLDGFWLYLMRNVAEKSISLSPPELPPFEDHAPIQADNFPAEPVDSVSLMKPCLAITKSIVSLDWRPLSLKKAADEGLVVLQSPKVGFFKQSRTIKGKLTPPACKEKQIVKEGQVLCYVEQLGGDVPIEADVSGEVIKILLEDGGMICIKYMNTNPEIKKAFNSFIPRICFNTSSFEIVTYSAFPTEPVGYEDPLITILPSFPGRKMLD